ncbi:protein disulfide isomerase Creld2-like isoform X1 [Haliotis rubra]|uniref:protein disulfide isomerase Creld2-like isoform X1 n=1 Tax=Haliotis rubra TaxID=36100 RepID=UPI001EE5B1DA|nr:protein disulfide isomerase Creld2-like isoform X1 [Haliotis rubra]
MHGDIRKRALLAGCVSVKNVLVVVIVFILLLGMPVLVQAKKKKTPDCSTCKGLVSSFQEGLKKTAKSNYGGGNTNWEEKSLGSYAKSEVRLVEIMEDHLCKGGAKECHSMLEEYEDRIEAFWFKEFAKKDNYDFHQWLCIDNIKACCPENTFGPECKPCPGDPNRPCSGTGYCDGEGTRGGSGDCRCHSGYLGDMCNECADGYFEQHKNDTHTVCRSCHISCKGTCWEEGPKGCDECKVGWLHTEEHGCKDVDECSSETLPCDDNQYCINTEGSHSCLSCDISCEGCTGSGDRKCKACSEGFLQEGDICKDVDECAADSSLCTGIMERCVNEPGTYSCQCKEGYHRNSADRCVKKPKDIPKSNHPSHQSMDKKKAKKQKTYKNKNAPNLLTFIAILAGFGICLKFSRGNMIIIVPLTGLISYFVYWYASFY